MGKVIIYFLGPARDLTGQTHVDWTINEGETLGKLAGRLAETYPKLGVAVGLRLAVNRSYVPLNQVLKDGDEIAVIPPVSGGADLSKAVLTRESIDVQKIIRELGNPEAGAIVTFLGTVRAERQSSHSLIALEYEAYEAMAIEQMEAIRRKAVEKFGALDAATVHRLGRIGLGEASIAVVVVTPHRAEGFDACRYIVDAIKTDVPIWKKNVWSDGAQEWVDPTC